MFSHCIASRFFRSLNVNKTDRIDEEYSKFMNGAGVVAGVDNRSITVVLFVMCSAATHLFAERRAAKLIVYTNICQICQTGTDLFGEAAAGSTNVYSLDLQFTVFVCTLVCYGLCMHSKSHARTMLRSGFV